MEFHAEWDSDNSTWVIVVPPDLSVSLRGEIRDEINTDAQPIPTTVTLEPFSAWIFATPIAGEDEEAITYTAQVSPENDELFLHAWDSEDEVAPGATEYKPMMLSVEMLFALLTEGTVEDVREEE